MHQLKPVQLLGIIIGLVVALLPRGMAHADVIFYDTPGALMPDENVLLNQGASGVTVVGTTNGTGTQVNFTNNDAPRRYSRIRRWVRRGSPRRPACPTKA